MAAVMKLEKFFVATLIVAVTRCFAEEVDTVAPGKAPPQDVVNTLCGAKHLLEAVNKKAGTLASEVEKHVTDAKASLDGTVKASKSTQTLYEKLQKDVMDAGLTAVVVERMKGIADAAVEVAASAEEAYEKVIRTNESVGTAAAEIETSSNHSVNLIDKILMATAGAEDKETEEDFCSGVENKYGDGLKNASRPHCRLFDNCKLDDINGKAWQPTHMELVITYHGICYRLDAVELSMGIAKDAATKASQMKMRAEEGMASAYQESIVVAREIAGEAERKRLLAEKELAETREKAAADAKARKEAEEEMRRRAERERAEKEEAVARAERMEKKGKTVAEVVVKAEHDQKAKDGASDISSRRIGSLLSPLRDLWLILPAASLCLWTQ
ncbi:Enriched in surface-labeled proteome protein 6 [Trypanosoma brucei equiperdum]|uniref:Enriched in surface-labeled proteome protein 6 n=1 Tax=Trypanosoma brucei equiperdum TaxID=630700 RepID=A0A3L6L0H4_9TRYP|nr:Enriched in surface-labeled proteome protein 6 [Trypanosoma brucei equiperdum]